MRESAGILLFRRGPAGPGVFLVHPGGPYWAHRDAGAWSVPKGEIHEGEDRLDTARREMMEETGFEVAGDFIELTPVRLASGKKVYAWALEQDVDPTLLQSNTCLVEWPTGSGVKIEIPEVDRGEWFSFREASQRINPGQLPLLNELEALLRARKDQ